MERIVVNLKDGAVTNVPLNAEELAAVAAYNSVDAVRTRLKAQVVELMIQKQDGGIVFNGLPVSTDNNAKGDLTGAKLATKASRKIVTRKGGGAKAELTEAAIDALFSAVEQYRQSVMDRAYDLLVALEAAQDPAAVDINAGWPSNVITS